jgi:hypothetical protein
VQGSDLNFQLTNLVVASQCFKISVLIRQVQLTDEGLRKWTQFQLKATPPKAFPEPIAKMAQDFSILTDVEISLSAV